MGAGQRYSTGCRSRSQGEERIQSFAYVFERRAVLSLVYIERESVMRIIGFRPASAVERAIYHDWLQNDFS